MRYRAIDKCLSAKHGRYSWDDLQRACEDALYRAFSERISVSRRQIFNDLNFMESEAGFRALIKRTKDGKRTYYTYEDMGNGFLKEVPHEREVYKTEYYTESVPQPVYVPVPRYATKYY